LWRWQGAGKVCNGPALALVQTALDLEFQDGTAPPVFNGLLDVPQPLILGFHLVQKDTVVELEKLCSNLLHNLFGRVGFSPVSPLISMWRSPSYPTPSPVAQWWEGFSEAAWVKRKLLLNVLQEKLKDNVVGSEKLSNNLLDNLFFSVAT